MMNFINKVTSMIKQGKSEKEGSCSTDSKPVTGKDPKSGGCCGGHCH